MISSYDLDTEGNVRCRSPQLGAEDTSTPKPFPCRIYFGVKVTRAGVTRDVVKSFIAS